MDPYSVSGFLMPAQYLKKEGVKVEPRFLGSHDKALEALQKGEVAAIATYGGQGAGMKNLRVLAVAGLVPNEPFVFRKGLRPERRRALEAALRALASDPEGRQALLSLAGISGFGPVDERPTARSTTSSERPGARSTTSCPTAERSSTSESSTDCSPA